MAIHATGQRMKPPARDIHLLWGSRLIQGGKLAIEFFSMMRLYARLATSLKERLKPPVAKRFDHRCIVSRSDTPGKVAIWLFP